MLYIILAALLDPLIAWWGYAILQFILISEAWFIFGQTRPSIAVGNFLQRYLTTTEPRRAELEVAVESLNKLLQAEGEREDGMMPCGYRPGIRAACESVQPLREPSQFSRPATSDIKS